MSAEPSPPAVANVEVRELTVRVGERALVDAVAFDAPVGAFTAVVGPNGAGKSTLLRGIAGIEQLASGMVLHDGLTAAGSRIAAGSLGEAPVPSLRDTPPMDIVLIDDDGPPAGAGETAIVAAAGAIANAIRDATGVRLTRFPLQPSLLARRGP